MSTSRLRALRLAARYLISRTVATLIANAYLRIRVEGRERYPAGAAVICLNHQNWADPFILMACLPWPPRLYFFGAPIESEGRPTRETVEALTQRVERDLAELVAGYPDPSPPRALGRWLTELFNEWPEGSRDLAMDAQNAGLPANVRTGAE